MKIESLRQPNEKLRKLHRDIAIAKLLKHVRWEICAFKGQQELKKIIDLWDSNQ